MFIVSNSVFDCAGTKPTSLRGVGDYQKAFVMSSLQDNGKNFEFKLAEDLELFPFPFLSPQ